MTVVAWIYSLLGVCIGSFLNVCIDRLPAGGSVLSPPSHCPHCERRLTGLELIPILSYIFLRGRCKECGGKIPLRVLTVELGTGIIFLLTWLHFGQSWETLLYSLYGALLVVIGVVDLENQKKLKYTHISSNRGWLADDSYTPLQYPLDAIGWRTDGFRGLISDCRSSSWRNGHGRC